MSDINGFDACAQALKDLLAQIEQSMADARGGDADDLHNAVLDATRKLVEYTNRTEPNDPFDHDEVESIRQLDRQADQARRDIFGASADDIIGRIHDRTSELNQLVKNVNQQTAANERRAKELRLVPVRNTIDALTETVAALKEAKDTLSDDQADEALVKSKIESVQRAVTALEKAGRDLFASA